MISARNRYMSIVGCSSHNSCFDSLIKRNKVLFYLNDLLIAIKESNEHLNILYKIFDTAFRQKLESDDYSKDEII